MAEAGRNQPSGVDARGTPTVFSGVQAIAFEGASVRRLPESVRPGERVMALRAVCVPTGRHCQHAASPTARETELRPLLRKCAAFVPILSGVVLRSRDLVFVAMCERRFNPDVTDGLGAKRQEYVVF